MSYKYEIHSHSKPVSGCSQITPEELCACIAAKGYNGAAVTNHYYIDWFTTKKDMSEEAKLDLWLSGWRETREQGQKLGLDILLGAELRFPQTAINDYLLYGCDEEYIMNNPYLYEYGPEKMHEEAKKHGFYFGQAHPCRDGCYPVDTAFVDGMETYNGHPSANNHMEKTYSIVKQSGIISTVGTDFHEAPYAGRAAMLSDEKITDSGQLAGLLLSGKLNRFLIPRDIKEDASLPFAEDDRYIPHD